MIYLGIDDTDVIDSPGTNKLARELAARLADRYRCRLILRHQLLFDPRVPYTSHNGSASLQLEPHGAHDPLALFAELKEAILDWIPEGSDPGLCLTERVPEAVVAFGWRCQIEVVRQADARALAAGLPPETGLRLEGLAGTCDGVIGALAAVGLAASHDDGRVIRLGDWADDLSGAQDVTALAARGVVIEKLDGGGKVAAGRVNVGKHLRPNIVAGQVKLFVIPASDDSTDWEAVRRP